MEMELQNIPLSPLLPRDKLIWRCTANGLFSVFSAYHLAIERKAEDCGGASRQEQGSVMWKVCWKLKVPNAVKMFVWRACHNLLPTKAYLFKRRVTTSPLCPICNLVEESIEHFLWSCPSATDVWSCGSNKLQKSTCVRRDFTHLFEELIDRLDQSELEIFVVIARSIWMRRNDVVHGGSFTHPRQVFTNAVSALTDFQRVTMQSEEMGSTDQQISAVSWQPPNKIMVEVNWDAAIDQKIFCVGLGLLARDANGSFLVACGIKMRLVADPTMAEALAALHAVIFAKELGFSRVIFEGDALWIVRAINSNEPCDSNYGHFVEDVKTDKGSLEMSTVTHVVRGANSAAHGLAKEACTHVINKYWWHSIPSIMYW